MFVSRKDQRKSEVKKVAISAAIAGAVAYIAGILTAPKSGKETRKEIADKTNDTLAAGEKELKKMHTELNGLVDQVTDKVKGLKGKGDKQADAALKKGQDAKQKARELLSTLHDGEADDRDLKKAIQDASKAIEHLRDFLKK